MYYSLRQVKHCYNWPMPRWVTQESFSRLKDTDDLKQASHPTTQVVSMCPGVPV